MKQVYSTFIIETENGEEHPFLACVPDMSIMTEGDSLADVIEMVRDAIGVTGISMEDHGEGIPVPSDQKDARIKIENSENYSDFSKGILTFVDVDFSEYRRKIDTKTVRRNVALPSWLNYEAEKAGVNVSRILQEALLRVLNLERRS